MTNKTETENLKLIVFTSVQQKVFSNDKNRDSILTRYLTDGPILTVRP